MIRITVKRKDPPWFFRAGMKHEGVKDYPDDTFTKAKLKTLKAEKMLKVEEIKDKK
jgi:hypothetical protein